MADLDPNIIIDMSRAVAAIDERTKALQNADVQAQAQADHRHRNVMAAIETFVPRREIEAMNAATRTYAEQMAKDSRDHCDTNREAVIERVDRVEESLGEIHATAKSVNRWVLGAVGSGLLAAVGYVATHALHLKVFWQE